MDQHTDNFPFSELRETDHVVDMSQPEDLIKILTLGMILDFSGVLYRPRYETNDKYLEEIPQERMCFRVLWKTFAANYATRIGEEWVHPTYIYKLSVVAFAAALIKYRVTIDNVKDAVSADQLKKAVYQHFQKDHRDLVPALDTFLEEGQREWLVWSGPPITIERRDEAEAAMAVQGVHERRQHSAFRIY